MQHIRLPRPAVVRHRFTRLMHPRRWAFGLNARDVNLTDADLRADLEFGRD